MSTTTFRTFLPTTPGLESIVDAELRSLGLGGAFRSVRGGFEGSIPIEALWRVCVDALCVEGARVRIARFEATNFDLLVKRLERAPWRAFFEPGTRVRASVRSAKSKLIHTGAIEERLRKALKYPGVELADDGEQIVHVAAFKDRFEISLDAVGALRLHQRGLRTILVKGALRETLAASCIAASRAGAAKALVDPFCGSGTMLIESALARWRGARPPSRRFAFEGWRNHDSEAWATFVDQRADAPRAPAVLIGGDVSGDAIASARSNIESLKQLQPEMASTLRVAKMEETLAQAPDESVVVSNIPHGKRIPVERGLYRRLGAALQASKVSAAFLLTTEEALAKKTGLAFDKKLSFSNRGYPVYWMAWERVSDT